MRNSFVLIRGESDEEEDIWVGEVLLLFRGVVGRDKGRDETAFVQFRESVLPLSAMDDALGCVFLRWAAAESRENESDVDRMERANNRIAAGEWFGVIFLRVF